MATPSLKTRGFFAFYRTWNAHWPYAAGREAPLEVSRILQPFTPIWMDVEPKVRMWLDPYDLVTREILMKGTWEPGTLHELEQHMPTGGTFIDVGAHVGWYSLHAANTLGPKGHVIAVEPNPATLARLNANIGVNEASKVISVAPVACSDKEGTLTLFAAPRANTGESSLSQANASQEGQVAAAVQVRTRRLDDIIQEAGLARVDLIKIDVEGADLLVLKGAVTTLARYHPVVVVEVVDHQLRAMGASEQELNAFMTAHGYVAKRSFEQNTEFVPAGQ